MIRHTARNATIGFRSFVNILGTSSAEAKTKWRLTNWNNCWFQRNRRKFAAIATQRYAYSRLICSTSRWVAPDWSVPPCPPFWNEHIAPHIQLFPDRLTAPLTCNLQISSANTVVSPWANRGHADSCNCFVVSINSTWHNPLPFVAPKGLELTGSNCLWITADGRLFDWHPDLPKSSLSPVLTNEYLLITPPPPPPS